MIRRVGNWDSEPAMVRALFLAPFIQELAKADFGSQEYLEEFGFSAEVATRLYEPVPLRQFVALTEDMSRRLDRPFLGLEAGQRFRLADIGPFYALFTLADNLGEALARFARFQWAWQTQTSLDVVPGKTTTIYRYSIQDSTIWPRVQDAEFAISSLCSIIRQLETSRWRPVEVEFEHDLSQRRSRLSRFFRANVSEGVANSIVVTNEDLRRPLHLRMEPHDASLLPVLERHLLNLLSPQGTVYRSCTDHTAARVARRLGRAAVTIGAIAKDLNLSVRTLRRRLAAEQTSFRQILQDQRRAKLESLLQDGSMPLAALAHRLSYSDPAILARAFRNWTGTTVRRRARKR